MEILAQYDRLLVLHVRTLALMLIRILAQPVTHKIASAARNRTYLASSVLTTGASNQDRKGVTD